MNKKLKITKIPTGHKHIAELGSNKKLLQQFNDLCTKLTARIKQRKEIQELTLSNFSYYTRRVLRADLDIISAQYQNLWEILNSYWHYELVNDEDKRRVCSYTQLYQMACMIQQNHKDFEIDLQAHVAAKSRYYIPKLINQIQQTPGITFKELHAETQITPDILDNQLNELEKNGFVSGRNETERRRFVLTTSGRVLYQDLCLGTDNKWVDQWNTQRLFAYILLVKIIQDYEEDEYIHMRTVVDTISSLSENQISELLCSLVNISQQHSSTNAVTDLNRSSHRHIMPYDNPDSTPLLNIFQSEIPFGINFNYTEIPIREDS